MQIWRRSFATSAARLSNSSVTGPSISRCAHILQSSKGGTCSFEAQEVKVNGFIRSVRKQKRFAFAEISDGSTVEPMQAILKPAQAAEYVQPRARTAIFVCQTRLTRTPPSLSTGTAVEISGVWKACPPGKEQTHELQTTDVTIIGASDPEVSHGPITQRRIDQLTTVSLIADISNPKEIPQPRFPAPDSPSPHPNTLQFPPRALPVRVYVPARQCLPLPPKRRLYASPASDYNILGL
jgi:hypothetical protein